MKNGALRRIRTPDPQIRSLGETIEIIEVRSRKKFIGRDATQELKLAQPVSLPKASDTPKA